MMREMFMTWVYVLSHPGPGMFDEKLEDFESKQEKALAWLGRGILLAALVNGLSTFLYEAIFRGYVGSRQITAMLLLQKTTADTALLNFVGSPLAGGLVAFFGFLIGAPLVLFAGLMFSTWLAKMLGGTGSLAKQVAALALFMPGLMLIVNTFGIIRPIEIGFIGPVLWVYALVLSFVAVKSIHYLSTVKALIVVAVPFVVLTFVVMMINPPHA
jgi:hypothetical protein